MSEQSKYLRQAKKFWRSNTKIVLWGAGIALVVLFGANYFSHSSTCLSSGTPRNGIRQEIIVDTIPYQNKNTNDSNQLVGQSTITQAGLTENAFALC
jgi:predicted negative regulator of RcsB-dependent stress response